MEIKIDTINLKILQDLSVRDQTNIWMSAYRKAAKPLIATTQSNIDNKSYGLYRSIGAIPYRKSLGIWIGSRVSTQTVRQGKLTKVWYGRLVEFGHKKRGKGRNQGVGMVAGTHFFENAWNATYRQVYDSIGNEWINAIDKFMGRLNGKLKKFK
jgi:hypothetical protein